MYIANRQGTVIETHFFYYSTYLREYSEPFGVPIHETIIDNLHLTQLYVLCYWVHRLNASMQPRGLTIKEVKVPTDMNSLNKSNQSNANHFPNGSTWTFCMNYPGQSWTTMVYHELRTMFNHELSWLIMNYPGQPWTTLVNHELPWYIMNYPGQSWTTLVNHEIPWSIMNCQGQSWTTYHGQSWTAMV